MEYLNFIGSSLSSTANLNDKKIFIKLSHYKFLLIMMLSMNIIQITQCVGLNFLSVISSLFSIFISIWLLISLKQENLIIDINFEKTNSTLKLSLVFSLLMILFNSIDIILTFLSSFNNLKILLSLNNTGEKKFAYFVLFNISERLIFSIIFFSFSLYIKIITNSPKEIEENIYTGSKDINYDINNKIDKDFNINDIMKS